VKIRWENFFLRANNEKFFLVLFVDHATSPYSFARKTRLLMQIHVYLVSITAIGMFLLGISINSMYLQFGSYTNYLSQDEATPTKLFWKHWVETEIKSKLSRFVPRSCNDAVPNLSCNGGSICDFDSKSCSRVIGRAGDFNEFWLGTFHLDRNPYDNFTPNLNATLQGWLNIKPDFWERIVNKIKPKIAIEVGVWNGITTETISRFMKYNLKGGLVIAIDTWQGATEFRPRLYDPQRDLKLKNGYPMVYFDFLSNMVNRKVSDIVAPLPMPSITAAEVLSNYGFIIDLIHIDGDHSYNSVVSDIKAWWPLLRPNGMMVFDDYGTIHFNGLTKAVNEFLEAIGEANLIEIHEHKLCVTKSL